MGMSASQARLLSITGRLTDNELKAQFITNDKLRLSAEQTEATTAYTNALDAEQLVFMGYDNNGAQKKISLTPALLYEYEPLKNQYILLNTSDQMLVGHTEAVNYEETDTLSDFLRRYDLLEDVTISDQQDIHNPEYDEWVQKHKEWTESEPVTEDYYYDEEIITTHTTTKFKHSDSVVYDALNVISCFANVMARNERCYSHVLASILGFGHFVTSNGDEFDIISVEEIKKYIEDNDLSGQKVIDYKGYQFTNSGWGWNSCTLDEAAVMDGLRETLTNDPVYDKAYEGDIDTELHDVVPVKGDGTDALKYNVENGGGCWQKCIDLIWELQNDKLPGMGYDCSDSCGGKASLEQLQKFWYFIELDLGTGEFVDEEIEESTIVTKFDQEKYDEDYKKWKDSEPPEVPEKITIGTYEELIIVKDKDKAQWYTNLWYKMNGSDSANLVRIDEEAKSIYSELKGKTVLKIEAAEKAEQSSNYTEYDSNLYKSAEWLQFALEHGVVTMQKASFFDPTEDNGRNLEYTGDGIYWKSIIYTNASDISSVVDNDAIEIAEVEYNRRKRAIQAKDKEYDADLRKLDTEHNALQTEYESLKNIIEKNVGRSFKTFS